MILLMRFVISGHSMEPTYPAGTTLLVSSIPYVFNEPKVGDVAVIKDPRSKKLLLKRIKKIQGKKFFVAGDNSDHSTDSRTFGPITKDLIVGEALYKL